MIRKKYRWVLFFCVIYVGITTYAQSQVLADNMNNYAKLEQKASQQLFLQQQVTLTLKNQSLKVVLQKIAQQTGIDLAYREELVESYRDITVEAENVMLKDLLDSLFQDKPLDYWATGNYIIIRESAKPEQQAEQLEAVTGTVTDTQTGDNLPGVNISVKGTTAGTSTDASGKYTLNVPSLNDTLIFSYIGYQVQEVAINGRTEVNVALQSTVLTGEDLVVVGYSEQRAEVLTGSVSRVQGDELEKAPVTNVSQGLAGRLPGVVAISNTGEPGYDGATIRIRGLNTFGDANPLVVVDGVPGRSLERIDPNTVESISVLKDASAAIYGAQAANGVILITTKRGTTGKPTIKFSYNQGFARPTTVPEMTNAAQYATLLNEIDMYAGSPERYTAEEIQKFSDGSDPWSYPNTDWFDETLKPWSPQSSGNISVNGGTDNLRYFVSGSLKGQEGFYENSATKYNQYDLRSNLDFKVNDHIDLVFNAAGRLEDRNYPVRSAENIFRMLMRSKPNMPAYWPNGLPGPDIEYGDNPVVISTDATGYDDDRRYILNSDFALNVDIPWIKGLSAKANASLDKYVRFEKTWQTPWYLYNWDGQSYDENGDPVMVRGKKGFDDPRLYENMEDTYNILLSGLINYERTIAEDHEISLMGGIERIKGEGDLFNAYRRYFLSPAIDQMFAGGRDEINNDGSGWENARLNYFGRANYHFKNKYLWPNLYGATRDPISLKKTADMVSSPVYRWDMSFPKKISGVIPSHLSALQKSEHL